MRNDNVNGKFFMGSTWLAIPKEDPRLRCGTTQITGSDMIIDFGVRRKVEFDKPFIEQPKVAIFFRSLMIKMPDQGKDQALRDWHLNAPEPGWRASIKCENVGLNGFDIVLFRHSRGAQADIDWVAHLAADPTVRSGSHSNSMMYRASPFDCRCDFSDGPMPRSPDIIIRGWSEISVKSADDLKCKHDQKDVSEKGFTWVTADFNRDTTEGLGGNWVAMMAQDASLRSFISVVVFYIDIKRFRTLVFLRL
jgi:hypothetical protein